MKLALLGTTGYHPNNRRETACFMLPELGVLLDAGTAMFRVRDRLVTDTLDIFLTHAHLDHVVGLTFLFDVIGEKTMQHVRVHGEERILGEIEKHLFAEAIFPVRPPLDFIPIAEQVALRDGSLLTHFPLSHPGGSLGYRVDWPDRSFAYVTDTTADISADYVEKIRGVDLLLHECYFPDGHEKKAALTGHSCLTPVAQVAAAADVGRVVLVHINPLDESDRPFDLTAARRIFENIELGEDGREIDF